MKIAVIGTSYVGYVTDTGLAELSHDVIGTDKVIDKIDGPSQGISPMVCIFHLPMLRNHYVRRRSVKKFQC